MAHNVGRLLNPPLLETVGEINTFIVNQNYGVCKWALEVAPAAKKCTEDCPFPICVECDLAGKDHFIKPRYVQSFKGGQLCL